MEPHRILFYCHDSYGLGHLQRTLALTRHLHTRWPSAAQLIVTGSSCPQRFCFPHTADYIKLPSVTKVGAGRYEPRSLPISLRDIRNLRRDVLFSAARSFRPDLLIVDNVPAGLKNELLPTLRFLQRTGETRLILGLRDIVDDGARVMRDWSRAGIYGLLDNVYDRILIYGDPDVYDPVKQYQLSPRAAAKTRHVGYIRRESAGRSAGAVKAELGLRTNRLVVVTAGGGGDGFELLRTVIESIGRGQPALPFDCLLVTGPLMSTERGEALRRLLPEGSGVHLREFVDDLAGYIAAADAVVSMGGYNSMCEILSFRRPALIVPRVEPRREQLIRAEALAQRGLVRMIHPAELTSRRLLAELSELLEQPPRPSIMPAMDGLERAADELEAVLQTPRPAGRQGLAPAGVA